MPAPQLPNFGHFNVIKFGPGVVGRTAPVVVAGLLVLLGLAAVIDDPVIRGMIAVAVILIVVLYPVAAFIYSHFHQETSVLEGAEALQWRQADMATKGGAVIDGTVSSPPPIEIKKLEGSGDA